MGMHKARTCRGQEVPVYTGISINLAESLDLREKCILELLPAEGNDCMLTGHNGYHMIYTERKQVGKRNAFATDNSRAIGKCRCNPHDGIATERAAAGIWREV